MTQVVYDDNTLRTIYEKVIEAPNKNNLEKECIKCPECGKEILMIPTLRVMNQAIETHVNEHKKLLKENPIMECQTAIFVRLSLMGQVLQQACNHQVS